MDQGIRCGIKCNLLIPQPSSRSTHLLHKPRKQKLNELGRRSRITGDQTPVKLGQALWGRLQSGLSQSQEDLPGHPQAERVAATSGQWWRERSPALFQRAEA